MTSLVFGDELLFYLKLYRKKTAFARRALKRPFIPLQQIFSCTKAARGVFDMKKLACFKFSLPICEKGFTYRYREYIKKYMAYMMKKESGKSGYWG